MPNEIMLDIISSASGNLNEVEEETTKDQTLKLIGECVKGANAFTVIQNRLENYLREKFNVQIQEIKFVDDCADEIKIHIQKGEQ